MYFDDSFTFQLESPDGNAVIKCTELPLDIRHEIAAHLRLKKNDLSSEIIERYQSAICATVLDVSGLSDSFGEVSAERVRAKKISPRLLDLITTAFWAAINAREVSTEKKSNSGPE